MKMKRFSIIAVLSCVLLGFLGCHPDEVLVDSVIVRPDSVELTVGSTCQLAAVVLPSDAPYELNWRSSRPAVATVNANGLLTAVALGECDITVYANDKSDVCHVTVVSGDPTTPTDTIAPEPPQDSCVGGFDQNGASNALFSVAAGRQVRFSKGNLQYCPSGLHSVATGGTESGTWRFAENQWDYIGQDNANIASPSYKGWIDLFGWGTSGWNSGANAYQPRDTSSTYEDYYIGGTSENDLTGEYANADWGVYNAISNGGNQPGMWRTLTSDEWTYLLETRSASTACGYDNVRCSKATVGDVYGLIIFPDVYVHPSGVSTLLNVNVIVNESGVADDTYVLTMNEWDQMQGAGCIFLPTAGIRDGTEVYYDGSYGCYSSANSLYNCTAMCLSFTNNSLMIMDALRTYGFSVRLVMDSD